MTLNVNTGGYLGQQQHMILEMIREVTPNIDLDSIYFICKINIYLKMKGFSHFWFCIHDQVYTNDYSWLTLTYFMARSNLMLYAFIWEKC